MSTAIVWSKNGCGFCEQAKNLLKLKNSVYEERNINKDWTREQLLEVVPTAKTLPQIFVDDVYVGGYDELKKTLKA